MKEVLHLEIRKNIFNLLLCNPGLNLSIIAEKLDISVQLADYHLTYMKGKDLINITKEGGYKRYYIKGEIGSDEKKILSLLQQDKPLEIVMFLLNNPKSKPKLIRERLKISPALLSYYLKKLAKYQVISDTNSSEKNKFYVLQPEEIITLLIRYKRNMLLERFKGTWITDIPLSGKIPKEKK